MTPDDFQQLAAPPENADRRLELVVGTLVEKLPDNHISVIGMRIAARIGEHVFERDLGKVIFPEHADD